MSEPTTIGIAQAAEERARWLKAQYDAFLDAGFDEAQADRFCCELVRGVE